MARKNYGHLSLAPKILKNIDAAIDWKAANWTSYTVHLVHRLFEATEHNPGLNIVIHATDGLYYYFKGEVDFYLHFRKKHILLMAHQLSATWRFGDQMFGEEARRQGSWDAMWRLTTPGQLDRLAEHAADKPMVEIPKDQAASRNIPEWVQKFVFERDQGRCQAPGCGVSTDLHFDHLIPFAMGGGNDVKNIRLLCSTHNLEKSANLKF